MLFRASSETEPGTFTSLPLSSKSYLEMMDYLRTVVIQDAPALMKLYPRHELWKHSVFKSKEFLEYKELWENEMKKETPQEIMLKRAYPELVAEVKRRGQEMRNDFRQYNNALRHDFAEPLLKLQEQYQERQDSVFQVLQGYSNVRQAILGQEFASSDNRSNRGGGGDFDFDNESSEPPPKRARVEGSETSDSSQVAQDSLNAISMDSELTSRAANVNSASTSSSESQMDKRVHSINDLWTYYKRGSNGYMPLEALEANYKKSRKQCKYFFTSSETNLRTRFLKIVSFIKDLAKKEELNEEKAAHALHLWKEAKGKSMNLTTFAKKLSSGQFQNHDFHIQLKPFLQQV